MASTIPARVRPHLVCPICRGELTDAPGALVCTSEGVEYPVVDGVPYLVAERARRVRGPKGGATGTAP